MTSLLFDSFVPGRALGTHRLDMAQLLRDWIACGGAAPRDGLLPTGLVVSAMMRGYLTLMAARPPGNVHAGQTLRWGLPAPAQGDLLVSLRCKDKSLRHGRRWLTLGVTVHGRQSQPHLEGEMTFLWAA